ncbi:MAG: hypothetical protein IJE67_06255 [Peptococcaceae bacterium]|nr:hypothetical protein [Peptococcaceae bacterium]
MKRQSKIKKAISFILATAILATSSFTVYANDNTYNQSSIMTQQAVVAYETLDAKQKKVVESELLALKNLGIFNADDVKIVNINIKNDDTIVRSTEENYIFSIQLGDYINDITVLNQTKDETVYFIKQGSIENTLILRNDGKVILDGNEVTFSSNISEEIVANETIVYYRENPTYGTASDYTKYYDYITNSIIALENKIKNITATVFFAVISLIPGIGEGAVIAGVAGVLYTTYSEFAPECEYLSCQSSLYHHKNSSSTGYISAYGGYITKYYTSWYAEKDFADYVDTTVYYEIKQIV